MTRLEIEDCNNIEILKRLCIEQRKQLSYISEILISESKWNITSEMAIDKIRDYLVENQHKIKVD